MVAKFKSKTHLLNTFLDFLSRFLRVWIQSFQKVLIWPQEFFLEKNVKRYQKTQNFMLIFESVEKDVKKCTKKLKAKQVWRTWVKVKNVHIFVPFLLITFLVHFFKTISTDSKSAWNSAFFIPKLNFLIQNLFCSYLQFLLTLIANAQETAEKTENIFLWMCLRILLGNHQRVCITKLLKSLYPNIQWS